MHPVAPTLCTYASVQQLTASSLACIPPHPPITAGNHHTCALMAASRETICWSVRLRRLPRPPEHASGLDFLALSYAKAVGTVHRRPTWRPAACRGSNAVGQLGINGTSILAAPTAGAGLRLYFASLAAGAHSGTARDCATRQVHVQACPFARARLPTHLRLARAWQRCCRPGAVRAAGYQIQIHVVPACCPSQPASGSEFTCGTSSQASSTRCW